MNIVKEIERINKKELEHGIFGGFGKVLFHFIKNYKFMRIAGLVAR